MKLALSKDKTEAHLLIEKKDVKEITEDIVFDLLETNKVVDGVQVDLVKEYLQKIKSGVISEANFLVAIGEKPIPGEPEVYTFLLEDTSVENKYTTDSTYFNVVKGQAIWEMKKGVEGMPGRTVQGDLIPISELKSEEPKYNENILMEDVGETVRFVSDIDGIYTTHKNQWLVTDTMVLKEVGPSTGKIDVNVSVQVHGDVLAGCSIKTSKSVLVQGAVEDKTEIHAGGEIRIKGGLLGKESVIKAGGNVTAKFIQGGKVFAGGKITIESHIYAGLLHSMDEVEVLRSKKENSNVLSGMVVARNTIVVGDVGAPGRNEVNLHAGYDPILKSLNDNKNELEKNLQFQTVKLTRAFGVSLKSPESLKMINELPLGKRKTVIAQLNALKALSTKLSDLMVQIEGCGGSAFTENKNAQIHISGNVVGKINADVLGFKVHLNKGVGIKIFLDQDKKQIKVCEEDSKEIA